MNIIRKRKRDGVFEWEQVSGTELTPENIRDVYPTADVMLAAIAEKAQEVLDSGAKKNRAEYAKRAIRHSQEARSFLSRGDAESAVIEALRAAQFEWCMDVKGVEPQIVDGAGIQRTRRKAADNTNRSVQSYNSRRNARIRELARKLIASGIVTAATVATYMREEGLACGTQSDPDRRLSVKQIGRIIDG